MIRKFVQSPPVRLVLAFLAVGGAVTLVQWLLAAAGLDTGAGGSSSRSPLQLLLVLILAFTAIGAYYAYVRVVERRRVTETIVVCLTAGSLLVMRAVRKRRIVEPFWRRNRQEVSQPVTQNF